MFPPEMSRSVVTRALVLALCLSAPAIARADDADALIQRGVELRRAGNDRAALEQFRRAYDLAPTPRALAQLGLAEHALERWADGEEHLAKALEATQDPWIAKHRDTLEASRAEIGKHLGSLFVTGGPEGAELRVDGRAVGTLPLRRPLRLPLGTFSLETSAGGHVVAARAVTIVAGVTTHEDLSAPASGASPPASPEPVPAPSSVVSRKEERAAPPPRARTFAWIAAGGAVGLAAAGGVVVYLGNSAADDYNHSGCRDTPQDDACASQRRRGEREQLAGWTGLALGGALAATSAILFLSAPSEGERRLACAPSVDGRGASCALRF
jgi:hypothetical protein